VTRHRSVLAGAAIDSPSGGAPRAAALSTAGRVGKLTSDVLCRARCAPFFRGFRPFRRRSPDARPAFIAASSKATTSTNQDAFHRRVLPPPRSREASRGARHRSRAVQRGLASPAVDDATSRLPAPVRSPYRRARPRRHQAERPSAARRLLQPKHSASTTARSPEPRLPSLGDCTSRAPSCEREPLVRPLVGKHSFREAAAPLAQDAGPPRMSFCRTCIIG